MGAQNANAARHADVSQLPPEEHARLSEAPGNTARPPAPTRHVNGPGAGPGPVVEEIVARADLRNTMPPQNAARHAQRAPGGTGALTPAQFDQLTNEATAVNEAPTFLNRPNAAPPRTGNPVADRAIQLPQAQFRVPLAAAAVPFDHEGLGKQIIEHTLAGLGMPVQSQSHLRGRSFESGSAGSLPRSFSQEQVIHLDRGDVETPAQRFANRLPQGKGYNFDEATQANLGEPRMLSFTDDPIVVAGGDDSAEGDRPWSMELIEGELPRKRGSIVSDGNGGMRIHIGEEVPPILHKGFEAHERYHIEQYERKVDNLDVLYDRSKTGYEVWINRDVIEHLEEEIEAYKREIEVYEEQLDDPALTDPERFTLTNQIKHLRRTIIPALEDNITRIKREREEQNRKG